MAPDAIVRAPLPEPIARRLPGRLTFFEGLWWQIHADAAATIAELLEDGWSPEAAAGAMGTYTRWLCGNVEHAVELALFTAGMEQAA